MSLTIRKEELEQRQLALTIEVPEERVDKEMRRLAGRLAKNLRIPGFRPGKAPYQVVLKRFGREGVRAQAVEEMMNDILVEAMEQESLMPYARPTLDDMELEPTIFKLTVPLEPEVTLGDYRAERREVKAVDISDEAVDEAIEAYRVSKAEIEDVDRPAEAGDVVTLTGKGTILPQEDDEEEEDFNANNVLFDSQDGIEFDLDRETTFADTGFVDELIGLSVGDQKSFTITYPDDYEVSDFAGRQAQFEIEVINIKNRNVPELDEELIKEAGFENLEEMKAKYRENLELQAEEEIKSQVLDEWIDTLHAGATMVYPPAAIEEELDQAVENMQQQVKSYGWEWEDYLTGQQTTVAEMRETWREDSVRSFERGLVMREFIRSERLKITDEEIEAHVDHQLERFGEMEEKFRETMRQIYLGQDGLQRMANEVMVEKAFSRVKAILAGEAPDLDELEAAEAAAEAEPAAEIEEETVVEEDPVESEAPAEDETEAPEDEEETDS